MKAGHEIIADFDAIAGAMAQSPVRRELAAAERALLRHVPSDARNALDAGCGEGVATRALARRGLRVQAVDISPQMIALARARTPHDLDVHYSLGDFMTEPLPAGTFDVVLTVNVLHHLVLSEAVARLVDLTAPGGTLLIQDVVTRRELRYLFANVAGVIQNRVRLLFNPHWRSRAVAKLYERHGQGETYLTPAEVEVVYGRLLPGARIEHHIDWRYSAVWSRSPAT